jgi:hypothetical protein
VSRQSSFEIMLKDTGFASNFYSRSQCHPGEEDQFEKELAHKGAENQAANRYPIETAN